MKQKKKKLGRKLLSFLLTLAMIVGLMPGMSMTAYAEAGSGTIGTAAYTISDDGVLTVGAGEFTIENWASVFGTGGQSNNTPNDTAKSIKSVVFQEGAVLGSTNMTKMFIYWESLESADLTNLTASAITEMGYLFFGCSKLTSVTFGAGVETSKVQGMSQMFQGCSSLRVLDLSTFKVYTGTGKRSLYQTFYNCSKLATIRVSDDWYIPTYVSNGTTKNLVDGYNTFYGCNKLEGGNGTQAYGFGDYSYAVIDGKDGKKGYFTSASAPVEHRHEFSYSASGSTLTATCSASDCELTDNKVELTLTPPAKTIYGDSNSSEATLEGREAFNAATGLNIGSSQYYVYYNKGSDIQLGAAPTTPGEYTVKVTISNVAGSSYTLTADYTIAQKEIGLTWADTTFHYDGNPHVPTAAATGLVGSDKCDVTVTGEQTAIGTYTATASGLGNDWYKLPENTTTEFAIEGWVGTARYTIEEVPSPKKLFAAKSISHEITNGVLTIYGGEFDNADWKTAFANDDFITNTRDKITSVRFVKANDEDTAAKLTNSAQGMFQNWAGLKTIDFTNLDTSDVTWMSTMFYECSSLTELDLSPLDTNKVQDMSSMFYKCSKLEKITVGANWKTASSTSHMFSGCNELAGNAGTTYKALFGNYINTDDNPENPALPDVNGTYARVDGGKPAPGFFYNAHEHHLTYTVDQSKPWTITATCNADGCYLGDSNNHSVSISLVKPTLYVYYMDVLNKQGDEYDKGASPLATLTMQNVGDQTLQDSTTVADPDGKINGISISVSTFTDANTAAPTFEELTGATISEIEYYVKGSDTKLDKAPSDAGTYTAKVTIGDATASVDYRIARRFHSPVLTSPTKNLDFAFGETEQELIIPGTIKQVDDTDTSTFEYALGTDATTIPAVGWSTDIPKGKGEGPFYVFYRVAGDKNHGNAMESEFPNKSGYANTTNPEHESNSYKPAFSVIVVSKTAPTPPVAKTLTYNSQDQELVEAGSAATGTMQYALGTDKTTAPTDNWDTTIPKGKEPAVYYVWYRVVNTNDTTSVINEPACVQVPLSKTEPTVTAPTATATYGQTLNDVSMTNPDGNPEGSWAWVDAKATSVGDVGQHTFKAKFTPTDTSHYKTAEVDVSVTVNKADLTEVSVIQNGTLTYTGEAQTPEVTAAATAVNDQSVIFTYSKTQDGEYGDMPTVTNVSDGGTFYYKASAPNHNDKTGSFTVTVNKATPGEVTAPTLNTAVTYDPGQTLASVTLPDGWAWVTNTDVPTVGNSGYAAALTVDDANYDYSGVEGYSADTHKVTRTVTLTVNKAEVTAPTIESKTYNEQNQIATVPESTLYNVTQNGGGTNVGDYDVVLTLTDSTNYKWTDSAEAAKTLVFQITAASITDANVTLSDTSLVYSGSEQSVTVSSVKLGDTTLTADTDYEVTSGTTGTAKNTYTVTVTGKGNYKDTATAQWSIGLATPTIETIPTASAITYGQKLADSTLTNGAAKLGDTTVAGTFAWENAETKPAVSDSNATEYDVVFTPTDADNYAAVECKVKLTVNKAAATVTAPTPKTLTYTGSAQELVNAGSTNDGTLYYAVTTENSAPTDESLYTTSIPTKTNAGTYYVWYKVVGDDDHTDTAPACITVTIASKPSDPYVPYVPSDPAAPAPAWNPTSAPNTEAYTIPVSNENTVDISANISEGNAVVQEITQADLNKVTETSSGTGSDGNEKTEDTTISIDVSNAKSEVTSVELSGTSVETLAKTVEESEKVDSVEIKMTNATVELDSAAVSAIAEQKEGNTIRLVVENKEQSKLNETQKESLKSFSFVQPFQAYFESGGKEIHDFGGGKATVSIKFTPAVGRDAKHYHMYYIPASGLIERYVTRYLNGMLTFVTSHFSDYAIVYDETMENETGKENAVPSPSPSSTPSPAATPTAEPSATATPSTEPTSIAEPSASVEPTTQPSATAAPASAVTDKEKKAAALALNAGLKVIHKGKTATVQWGKVSGADFYRVYAGYCGGKASVIKTVKSGAKCKVTIKKLNGKKLSTTKNIKVYVAAYRKAEVASGAGTVVKNVRIAKTITGHVVGKNNKKYSNAKKITLSKSSYTLKKGKKAQIKAKTVLEYLKRKQLSDAHAKEFRYASTDKSIAAVNKKGKITAKKSGNCIIYVYARNGMAKEVKIKIQ